MGSEHCLNVIAGCACSIYPKLARCDSIHNLQEKHCLVRNSTLYKALDTLMKAP